MTPERWKRTEELYHAAGALPPSARPAFLSQACLDDQELQREVESLLNEPRSDDGLLEGPGLVVSAKLLSDLAPVVMIGRVAGRLPLGEPARRRRHG